MDINQMRTLDKWLGVPLCALFSLCRKFLSLFSGSQPDSLPSRILFIEMSEMGSMVLATSMLLKAKTLFPRSGFYFLTFLNHRHAVDILNIIPKNHVITIDPSTAFKFLYTTFTAIRRLRGINLDAVVDMELFSRFSAVLSCVSGARFRSGYFQYYQEGLYRGDLLTHPVQFNPHLHISRNLLALVTVLAAGMQEKPMLKKIIPGNEIKIPRFQSSNEEKNALRQKIIQTYPHFDQSDALVLLNPNAGDIVPLRRWPLSRYVQLGRSILNHPGLMILITGTAGERPQADTLVKRIGSSRCVNFAGWTSFRELMVLYDISTILVTNDSGPAHFSTMTGIRSFVLFGPETPALYGPLSSRSRVFYSGYACSPCVSAFNHRRTPCRNNRCLQSISSDQVYQEIRPWLPEIKTPKQGPLHE
jgi:ADP-heptose:LPS heptosyltransferase